MYTALIKIAVSIVWQGTTVLLMRGQILQLVAGGSLETAIGTGNITNVTAQGGNIQGMLGTSN